MSALGLRVHAVRAARPRQLAGRALRPLRRRRFPAPRGAGPFRPLPDAEPLWRSRAFAGADEVAGDGEVRLLGAAAPFPPADWSLPGEPRLRRFHLHYGDEVLGWARRGDAEAARRALEAWIDGNPPRPGDAWHPYTLSTRAGNWVAALTLLPELGEGRVVESLRRQLAHLERNVEDDVLGNHVIRNARAFVLGGAALGDRALAARGEALLRRELPEQVLPDGGHYERSPAYHLVVLRDLLEARAAGVERLDDPIGRMERFAAALARPDGAPALFNDGSLDLAPELELPAPPAGLAVFPDTGYAVLREGRVWLALDCGPPAPPFLPAHAHADALSFQLWVDGEPAVVDPGTFTYAAGAERDWFRSTRAHSTVAPDGRDQFELWGAFRAGPLPRVRLLGTAPLAAEVEARGYLHRRTVRVGPDAIAVEDEVSRPGRSSVLWSATPLAPGTALRVEAAEGEVEREQGWLSERMYERAPAPVVRARTPCRGRVETGWTLGLPSAP